MTRRLMLSYLGLALLILVVLEIPLGVLAARHERDLSASQAERQATGLAAIATESVEHNRTADLVTLVQRYHTRTSGEVAVTDPAGRILAVSSGDQDDEVNGDQRGLVQAALSGRSVSSLSSDEGRMWAAAAVPISAGGPAEGVVLLSLPAGSTEDRIHDIWLALGGFAIGVLTLTGLVGMLLARSLSRPLAHLESTVSRLGEGQLTTRARDDDGPPQVRSLARQFNQMALRLSELVDAQSRFVADASHQLRSPLTALRLRLENLEAASSGHTAEVIAAAGREVQRLSRIVDGLLTLSRADPGQPDRQPVDLNEVISDRCQAWGALADERHVRLTPELPADRRPTARLVPGDLDQMLDNLLANALDASPEGSAIEVRLQRDDATSSELHVLDQGPGMTAGERGRAFDRFWQGAAANGGHSGLGLAIVRQLAARNGLSVDLRPHQPTGLDAVVRLPDTYAGGRDTVKKSRDSRVGPR